MNPIGLTQKSLSENSFPSMSPKFLSSTSLCRTMAGRTRSGPIRPQLCPWRWMKRCWWCCSVCLRKSDSNSSELGSSSCWCCCRRYCHHCCLRCCCRRKGCFLCCPNLRCCRPYCRPSRRHYWSRRHRPLPRRPHHRHPLHHRRRPFEHRSVGTFPSLMRQRRMPGCSIKTGDSF